MIACRSGTNQPNQLAIFIEWGNLKKTRTEASVRPQRGAVGRLAHQQNDIFEEFTDDKDNKDRVNDVKTKYLNMLDSGKDDGGGSDSEDGVGRADLHEQQRERLLLGQHHVADQPGPGWRQERGGGRAGVQPGEQEGGGHGGGAGQAAARAAG